MIIVILLIISKIIYDFFSGRYGYDSIISLRGRFILGS